MKKKLSPRNLLAWAKRNIVTLCTYAFCLAVMKSRLSVLMAATTQSAIVSLITAVVDVFIIIIAVIGLFTLIPALIAWAKNSQNPDAQSQDTPTNRLAIGAVMCGFSLLYGVALKGVVSGFIESLFPGTVAET